MKGRKARLGRPPIAGEPGVAVGLRLTRDILRRLDEYAERLKRERPGTAGGRSEAARALLLESLDRHHVR